jgi:hypothetical protein
LVKTSTWYHSFKSIIAQASDQLCQGTTQEEGLPQEYKEDRTRNLPATTNSRRPSFKKTWLQLEERI